MQRSFVEPLDVATCPTTASLGFVSDVLVAVLGVSKRHLVPRFPITPFAEGVACGQANDQKNE